MMKNILKPALLACGLALFACMTCPAPTLAAETATDVASTDVHLVLNGQPATLDPAIGRLYINHQGRTMLPLRAIGEASGANVSQAGNRIVMQKPLAGFMAWMDMDSRRFVVNYQEHYMDVSPVLSPEWRIYLPARAIAETFGTVDWDPATRTVTITSHLQEERTHTQYSMNKSLFYELTYGTSLEQGFDIFLDRKNPEKNTSGTLLFPAEKASEYKSLGMDALLIKTVKDTGKGSLIAVETPQTRFEDNTMDVFFDDYSSNTLQYVGLVTRTGDFACDGTYVFSTDGVLPGGPGGVDEKEIYVQKMGDPSTYRFIDLDIDFSLNECKLQIEGSDLVATSPDGSVHRLAVANILSEAGLVS
jgi:hypothetical protein